jgi:hypothetical protein
VVRQPSQRLSACTQQPRGLRGAPSNELASGRWRRLLAPDIGFSSSSTWQPVSWASPCIGHRLSSSSQSSVSLSDRRSAAPCLRRVSKAAAAQNPALPRLLRGARSTRRHRRDEVPLPHPALNPATSGKPAVQPNPSLKLTRYGRLCKPGPRQSYHRRVPGLQSLPPRAA